MKAGQRVGGLFLEDLGSDQIARAVACFRHPTLVVHGTADQRIPPASSEGLMRHSTVEFKANPDAGCGSLVPIRAESS